MVPRGQPPLELTQSASPANTTAVLSLPDLHLPLPYSLPSNPAPREYVPLQHLCSRLLIHILVLGTSPKIGPPTPSQTCLQFFNTLHSTQALDPSSSCRPWHKLLSPSISKPTSLGQKIAQSHSPGNEHPWPNTRT